MASVDTTIVDNLFTQLWKYETTKICKHITSRLDGDKVNPNLLDVRKFFFDSAKRFNDNSLKHIKFRSFQWCMKDDVTSHNPTDDEILDAQFWVFGLRLGPEKHTKKISIICHLDTVPADPDSPKWDPYDPQVFERHYEGGTVKDQNFLVGRGCIDDKGPAISAFIAARALALKYDSTNTLNDSETLIEFLFDSSEETDMSTPHYLEDPDTEKPSFGVVYDAMWIVRAEKGGERPVFTVSGTDVPPSLLYISSLITNPSSSTNTIPDWAEAEIRGDTEALAHFAEEVAKLYNEFEFDDPNYNSAEMEPPKLNRRAGGIESVTLRTLVSGAQHGSAPDENRKTGANPLVSLANFLAGLVNDGQLGVNAVAAIVEFIRWTWGTHVFGEMHEALYKFDNIFTEGNGTTYGVTKTSMAETGEVKLEIDIRYAIPHHIREWDGQTEGLLQPKKSKFDGTFDALVLEFNSSHSEYPDVICKTETIFSPDIRVPESNTDFQMVIKAYKEVRGEEPRHLAIGGGTDAKGFTFLLAVGPLFSPDMGWPIQYHGINEGAPMKDIQVSTAVLFRVLSIAAESPATKSDQERERSYQKSIASVREIRQSGYTHCCC